MTEGEENAEEKRYVQRNMRIIIVFINLLVMVVVTTFAMIIEIS